MTSAEIKDSISMIDVCHRYGLKIRKGFIHCPFHGKDRTASLKIYPNNTWHCFACGAGGDIFSFVSRMENKPFKEVFEMLGGTKDKTFAKEWKKETQKREDKTAYYKSELRFWNKLWANVRKLIKELPPYSDEWVKAINLEPIIIGEWEYFFNELYGNKKHKYI